MHNVVTFRKPRRAPDATLVRQVEADTGEELRTAFASLRSEQHRMMAVVIGGINSVSRIVEDGNASLPAPDTLVTNKLVKLTIALEVLKRSLSRSMTFIRLSN